MKSRLIIPIFFSFLFFFVLVITKTNTGDSTDSIKKATKLQRIKDAIEEDNRRTKDLTLGYPPKDRLRKAIAQTKARQLALAESWERGDITMPHWKEKGPSNIGGRTRTLMIDLNDPTRNTLWAGGVSGGLWKCENINEDVPHWRNMSSDLNNLSIGALAQDPNNPQIMYVGTGEGLNGYNMMTGDGIYKSTDGGESWTHLAATSIPEMNTIQAILVHPSGDVYAGARAGLYRSQDGGENWERVRNTFIWDIELSSDGIIYASVNNAVYQSTTGDADDWQTLIGHGFPYDFGRVEFSVSKSNPAIIYAVGSQNGEGSAVYKTINRGESWQKLTRPTDYDYTNGQVWYDLEIAVDPFDSNHVILGGVQIYHSFNGGQSWERFATNMHSDQHKFLFDPENEDVIYFGNDGGVFRSDNGSAQSVQNKNNSYNVTQFYACAIHPEAYTEFFLGGTQDNNSLRLNQGGLSSAASVWGGDGFYCHIDENEPDIQMVSSQYGNYGLSTNGGSSFGGGVSLNGSFYCPSDYDDESNFLYAQTNNNDFVRWNISNYNVEDINIPSYSIDVTTVFVDPNVSNRVYFGSSNGQLIRVDNANTDISTTRLYNGSGTISSVDVEYGNPDHLLISLSNYGLSNSILESTDGGQNWHGVEGTNIDNNLPDIPVRWAIFNPKNNQQAVIATELGVWTTDLLQGNNTQWYPPLPESEGGIPLVRTDMLLVRKSDKVVLAATHGRGLFTTDVFADPFAKIGGALIHYVNAPFQFRGDASFGADSWHWDFGDGETADVENPIHTYTHVGEFPVTLTINGSITTNSTIKILPHLPLPYIPNEGDYGGDFEYFDEHFGAYAVKGSPFEKGNSDYIGKNGVHSGDKAYVLDLTNNFYLPGTESYLYTPAFDFSDSGIYEFKFWSKFLTQAGLDGFLVEYSTDKGQSWSTLGEPGDEWYNFTNANFDNAAFTVGSSYFSGERIGFKEFSQNISFLAGNDNVAFRFTFRSENTGNYPGVVIDDVEILKYQEEPVTKVNTFVGEFSPDEFGTKIVLDWSTFPEYKCDHFELEVSENGKTFEHVVNQEATGVTTLSPQNYSYEITGRHKNLYFFRLKVHNEEGNYQNIFYTPTIIVKRNVDNYAIHNVFPSPFTNRIEMTFTDVIDKTLVYELFNISGQLIAKGAIAPNSIYYAFDVPAASAGVYILRTKIGDQDSQVFRLMRISD